MKKLSYRALVKEALRYSGQNNHKAAATAWVNAAEAAGRYDDAARELCGREAVREFNAAWIEPAEISRARESHRRLVDSAFSPVLLPTLPGTSLDVFYWPMAREGEGKRGHTRGAAYMLCGTAMIGIEGVAGGIALSHVLVVSDGTV